MSIRECPVLNFDFKNAKKLTEYDNLYTIKIGDSEYSYVLNWNDWNGYVGKVFWVQPDTLVDIRKPEFSFLSVGNSLYDPDCVKNKKDGKYARVKAKRFKSTVSYGLLCKYSGNLESGQDAFEELGLIHYEQVESNDKRGNSNCVPSVDAAPAPVGVYYKYDVENILKFGSKMFTPEDRVTITLKMHGQNFRAVNVDGLLHVGSRTEWKKEFTSPPNITVESLIAKGVSEEKAKEIYNNRVVNFKPTRSHWWTSLHNHPELVSWLSINPGYCVYGELINSQGGFDYKLPPGRQEIRLFDILKPDGQYMDSLEFIDVCAKNNLPKVPTIEYNIPYRFEHIQELVEKPFEKWCGNHVNEGLVIGTTTEKYHEKFGRCKLKIISSAYYEKN